MADTNILKLNSIIDINGTNYSVTAVTAEKVENTLTIKDDTETKLTFDGSKPTTLELKTINGNSLIGSGSIDISGGGGGSDVANKINVNTDFGEDGSDKSHSATITIKHGDPVNGNVGDIWFKY